MPSMSFEKSVAQFGFAKIHLSNGVQSARPQTACDPARGAPLSPFPASLCHRIVSSPVSPLFNPCYCPDQGEFLPCYFLIFVHPLSEKFLASLWNREINSKRSTRSLPCYSALIRTKQDKIRPIRESVRRKNMPDMVLTTGQKRSARRAAPDFGFLIQLSVARKQELFDRRRFGSRR
jgi:hypothetical protein